jgi:hypothetical protein
VFLQKPERAHSNPICENLTGFASISSKSVFIFESALSTGLRTKNRSVAKINFALWSPVELAQLSKSQTSRVFTKHVTPLRTKARLIRRGEISRSAWTEVEADFRLLEIDSENSLGSLADPVTSTCIARDRRLV